MGVTPIRSHLSPLPGRLIVRILSNLACVTGTGLALSRGMWPRALLLVFIALQAADGLLTYAAVERFGATVEGNPLLVTWMMLTGPEPALIGAKAMACLCGGLLYAAGVHHVLAGLSALYLFAAVVPWLRIFALYA
jgi:hypothetical protein